MSQSCIACGASISQSSFRGRLLDVEVNYYECLACGYVQTEQPLRHGGTTAASMASILASSERKLRDTLLQAKAAVF